jgi:hypothetical protein
MSDMIVNKVASSGLITLNLEAYLPEKPVMSFDLKDFLFMGLILKEKVYREALKNKNFDEYRDQYVAVNCSVDAVIPVWAYMLAVSYLQPVAKDVFLGTETEFYKYIVIKKIDSINVEEFQDERVVIKGCGEIPIDNYAYAAVTKKLLPVVKSIMYGEPCSTVPVYKKR